MFPSPIERNNLSFCKGLWQQRRNPDPSVAFIPTHTVEIQVNFWSKVGYRCICDICFVALTLPGTSMGSVIAWSIKNKILLDPLEWFSTYRIFIVSIESKGILFLNCPKQVINGCARPSPYRSYLPTAHAKRENVKTVVDRMTTPSHIASTFLKMRNSGPRIYSDDSHSSVPIEQPHHATRTELRQPLHFTMYATWSYKGTEKLPATGGVSGKEARVIWLRLHGRGVRNWHHKTWKIQIMVYKWRIRLFPIKGKRWWFRWFLDRIWIDFLQPHATSSPEFEVLQDDGSRMWPVTRCFEAVEPTFEGTSTWTSRETFQV